MNCIDCNKLLKTKTAQRCYSCAGKSRMRILLENPTIRKTYFKTYSRSKKGELNPNYKTGETLILKFCQKCGEKLSGGCKSGYCRKCHYQFKDHSYGIKISKALKGQKLSDQRKSKISQTLKCKWSNLEYRQRHLSRSMKAHRRSFSCLELQMKELLKQLGMDKFEFVGNGQMNISGFFPDFINKETNQIIEVYGEYWHSRPDYRERDMRRRTVYRQLGYQLLEVWESEFLDLQSLQERLLQFVIP